MALDDQPAFSVGVIAQLVAAQRATGYSIAAARYAGRLGVSALFLREHFPALAALEGDAGACQLLAAQADLALRIDLPALTPDLDTPADIATLHSPAPA